MNGGEAVGAAGSAEAGSNGAGPTYDLLLSSGFLAFARHAGVLAAIEAAEVPVGAVVGTSSGALVGALWAAGTPAAALQGLLEARPPYTFLSPHLAPWRGAFSLAPLVAWLRERLPATFAELPRPLAVGVTGPDGAATLLTEGDLPAAVAASCAIPYLFAPVNVGGTQWKDGGVVDRLMVEPWLRWRGERPAILHVVARSAGKDSPVPLDRWVVVRTPKSGASFWSLGDIPAKIEEARAAAAPVLAGLGRGG